MTMELHKMTDRVLDGCPDWAEICKAQAGARIIAAAPQLYALLRESQDSIGGTWRQRMGRRLDQVSAVSWYVIIMGAMVAFALLAYEIGGGR